MFFVGIFSDGSFFCVCDKLKDSLLNFDYSHYAPKGGAYFHIKTGVSIKVTKRLYIPISTGLLYGHLVYIGPNYGRLGYGAIDSKYYDNFFTITLGSGIRF